VILYHCFHVPVITGDAPNVIPFNFDDLEKENLELLAAQKKKLSKQYPGVKIDVASTAGFAADEIVQFTKRNRIGLLVMGITGSSALAQLLGDTTTSVAKNTEKPVLIVPPEAQYAGLKNIVIAFDRKETEHTHNIDTVLDLSRHFNSKVTALHIKQRNENVDYVTEYAEKQINEQLVGVDHKKTNFVTNVDTIEGIEHYLAKHKVDLLVMLKRKHNFFDLLIHGSNTKKMAFHTHIPLLVLHE
jgi:nucleotide-binding universal stress UspA family protein